MELEMTAKVRLCLTAAVKEGQPLPINSPGLPSLGVYLVGDDFYVIDNLCTHGKALLTDGYQEGRTIECPLHAGMFDICTGEAIAYPCQISIRTYPVTIEDGWVCIPQLPACTEGA
jgi:ethylbenzene dioxygenase ferredoxin subunit